MDLEALHQRAVEGWKARLQGVGADQWDGPTPCSEWDVRALANHVVGEDLWTRPLVEGQTIADVGDRFDGDVLGADPVAAGLAAADDALAAVASELPKGGVAHLSFGDFPVDQYVWQLTADHLIHSWDLAAATGQDRTLDEEVVQAVATWFDDIEPMMRDAGAIGPRAESEGGAQSDLLARFGRSSSW